LINNYSGVTWANCDALLSEEVTSWFDVETEVFYCGQKFTSKPRKKAPVIIPIFKNGGTTDPGNYRPVAILPSFSKILERIIYDQTIYFLDKHNIIYKYQFSIRKKYSAEQAILEITLDTTSRYYM
jgi:hypothetical protein